MVLAFWNVRQRRVDPEVARRRKLFADQAKRISAAANLSQQQAAEQVTDALRKLLPEADAELNSQTEALIARLETIIYAPNGDRVIDGAIVDEAKLLAECIREAVR